MTNEEKTTELITRDDIVEVLPIRRAAGNIRDDCSVFFSDRNYCMFTQRFVETDGFNGFKKWIEFNGIKSKGQLKYWKRNYDCDNLANAFKAYMNLLHARANPLSFTDSFASGKQNESEAEGVAVGVIYFDIRSGKSLAKHAINVVITRGLRNKLAPVYIEPSGAGKINLTKREKESIWYVNF
jgi:hypothetical protein